jgi:hypothetical protein
MTVKAKEKYIEEVAQVLWMTATDYGDNSFDQLNGWLWVDELVRKRYLARAETLLEALGPLITGWDWEMP